jgi:hypothetical protein
MVDDSRRAQNEILSEGILYERSRFYPEDAAMRQTCKACGREDKFDFHVSDEVWNAVLPARLRNHVVCLGCFDDSARRRQVDYATCLRTLYFAGDRAVFEFRVAVAVTLD